MNDADITHCVYWEVRHIDNSQVILGLIGDLNLVYKNDNTEEQSPIRPINSTLFCKAASA